MLKSKLSETAYPTVPWAEVSKWIKFEAGVDQNIDPIFLRRLAAWAKFRKQVLVVNSGSRSLEKQKVLFFAAGGKYDKVKGYYWPDSIPAAKRTVAKPGKSWHNFMLAIDTSSAWAKATNKTEATSLQAELIRFGIFKPMTKGNKATVLEDWHLQPYETNNVPVEKRAAMMPIAA